jgi:hypothetical protein
MVRQFTARRLFHVLIMEIAPNGIEKTVAVLAESDRFRHICSAIAEQFPGWQYGEMADWVHG